VSDDTQHDDATVIDLGVARLAQALTDIEGATSAQEMRDAFDRVRTAARAIVDRAERGPEMGAPSAAAAPCGESG
jgi:hypothetical protein